MRAFPVSLHCKCHFLFQGTENDKLLDIILKKDMVQTKLEELNSNKSQGPDEFIQDY